MNRHLNIREVMEIFSRMSAQWHEQEEREERERLAKLARDYNLSRLPSHYQEKNDETV